MVFGFPEHEGVSSRHVLERRKLGRVVHTSGGQSDAFVSKESLRNPSSGVPTQSDIEMGTVPLPAEDTMEVDFDAEVEPSVGAEGVQRESVRRGRTY